MQPYWDFRSRWIRVAPRPLTPNERVVACFLRIGAIAVTDEQ
jgi:hypothetical protein